MCEIKDKCMITECDEEYNCVNNGEYVEIPSDPCENCHAYAQCKTMGRKRRPTSTKQAEILMPEPKFHRKTHVMALPQRAIPQLMYTQLSEGIMRNILLRSIFWVIFLPIIFP